MPKFLERNQEQIVREVDKQAREKWKWNWLEEDVKVKITSDETKLCNILFISQIGINLPQYLDAQPTGQPFVLALGQEDAPTQCFTVIEGRALKQDTLLKAVDVCFKSFYVLDVAYPSPCFTTWQFILGYSMKWAQTNKHPPLSGL